MLYTLLETIPRLLLKRLIKPLGLWPGTESTIYHYLFRDKDVYQKLKGNIEGPLGKIIKSVLRKVRDKKDMGDETLDYYLVNNPKIGRFYFLPKIHKRLHNVQKGPVISSSGHFTKNILAFLEYHLKPIAQKS